MSAALLTLLALGIFNGFAWAVRRHFVSAEMPRCMQLLSFTALLTLAAYIATLWMAPRALGFQWAAAAMQASSGVLFAWAVAATRRQSLSLAFDRDAPQALISHGPYRFIRHPFYAAYTLFWLGCCVASLSAVVGAGTVVLVALYLRAATLEETKFAHSGLAEAYAAYRRQAGLMWPRFGTPTNRLPKGEAG